MEHIRIFRRRFLPDEITELKDDVILFHDENVITTKWTVLKPRTDIDWGVSAYFIKEGFKISKVFNKDNDLVYWYCDIIDTIYDESSSTYTFNDLLIDVLVYQDGSVKIVDMDEFADAMEKDIISKDVSIKALRSANNLVKLIYNNEFSTLTKYIDSVL